MANPYKRLKGILGQESPQVGTVQAVNADGTSQVQLVGGGVVQVAGDSFPVSQPVFIQGGQILSAAPSLNIQQIEV